MEEYTARLDRYVTSHRLVAIHDGVRWYGRVELKVWVVKSQFKTLYQLTRFRAKDYLYSNHGVVFNLIT